MFYGAFNVVLGGELLKLFNPRLDAFHDVENIINMI